MALLYTLVYNVENLKEYNGLQKANNYRIRECDAIKAR